jgi:NDP-sugar pyrophosphorylase family protein
MLDRPVLAWVIEGLMTAGISRVGVAVGYRGADVAAYLNAAYADDPGVAILLGEETPQGTGGALREHRGFLAGGPTLVVTADMLTDVDLRAMIRAYAERPVSVMVAVTDQPGEAWPGDVVSESEGLVGYAFKPGPTPGVVLGSAGTWIVGPEVAGLIPAAVFVDFSSEILPSLPRGGATLGYYYQANAEVLDIGAPDRLRDVNFLMATRVGHDGGRQAVSGVDSGGVVYVAPDATVDIAAELRGPVVICSGATLLANVVVQNSLILPGATVPAGAVIEGAVFG